MKTATFHQKTGCLPPSWVPLPYLSVCSGSAGLLDLTFTGMLFPTLTQVPPYFKSLQLCKFFSFGFVSLPFISVYLGKICLIHSYMTLPGSSRL